MIIIDVNINKNRTRYNTQTYQIFINDKFQNLYVSRITTITQFYLNFIYSNELNYDEAYFFYRATSFSSFLLNVSLDLIFVDKNGFIIKAYENFEKNKTTEKHKEAKFLYVFKAGSIKKFNLYLQKNPRIIHTKSRKKGKIVFERLNI